MSKFVLITDKCVIYRFVPHDDLLAMIVDTILSPCTNPEYYRCLRMRTSLAYFYACALASFASTHARGVSRLTCALLAARFALYDSFNITNSERAPRAAIK